MDNSAHQQVPQPRAQIGSTNPGRVHTTSRVTFPLDGQQQWGLVPLMHTCHTLSGAAELSRQVRTG